MSQMMNSMNPEVQQGMVLELRECRVKFLMCMQELEEVQSRFVKADDEIHKKSNEISLLEKELKDKDDKFNDLLHQLEETCNVLAITKQALELSSVKVFETESTCSRQKEQLRLLDLTIKNTSEQMAQLRAMNEELEGEIRLMRIDDNNSTSSQFNKSKQLKNRGSIQRQTKKNSTLFSVDL